MRSIEVLISKYKVKINSLQERIKFHEKHGRSFACISLNGEIQAYNAVISDLININSNMT
jgi:hypothetical protein